MRRVSLYILFITACLGAPGFTANADEFSLSGDTGYFEKQDRALLGDPAEAPLRAADILPVEEAFNFGSVAGAEDQVVFWQVLPGYYLYKDKVSISVGGREVSITLPDGEMRDDEIFGRVEVLTGYIEVSLPLDNSPLVVGYQGCAAQGYCYPPQKVVLNSSK